MRKLLGLRFWWTARLKSLLTKFMRQYDSYNEVLRDVIFEGLEKIFTENH